MAIVTVTKSHSGGRCSRAIFPVIVDFYADWCGPCKQIAPAMEALSEKWEGAVCFAQVDIDAHPEIATAYNISSIPAVLRFEQGEVTNWCIGAKPIHLIENELRLTKRGVGDDSKRERGLVGRLFGRA